MCLVGLGMFLCVSLYQPTVAAPTVIDQSRHLFFILVLTRFTHQMGAFKPATLPNHPRNIATLPVTRLPFVDSRVLLSSVVVPT